MDRIVDMWITLWISQLVDIFVDKLWITVSPVDKSDSVDKLWITFRIGTFLIAVDNFSDWNFPIQFPNARMPAKEVFNSILRIKG